MDIDILKIDTGSDPTEVQKALKKGLDARALDVGALVDLSGIDHSELVAAVKGQEPMAPDAAFELSRVLGVPALELLKANRADLQQVGRGDLPLAERSAPHADFLLLISGFQEGEFYETAAAMNPIDAINALGRLNAITPRSEFALAWTALTNDNPQLAQASVRALSIHNEVVATAIGYVRTQKEEGEVQVSAYRDLYSLNPGVGVAAIQNASVLAEGGHLREGMKRLNELTDAAVSADRSAVEQLEKIRGAVGILLSEKPWKDRFDSLVGLVENDETRSLGFILLQAGTRDQAPEMRNNCLALMNQYEHPARTEEAKRLLHDPDLTVKQMAVAVYAG